MRLLFPLLLGLSACSSEEPPRVLHVRPGIGGELDDASLSVTAWFTSIQDAVDGAGSGDTVTIPSGTYYEDVEVDKGITLQGAGQGETIIIGTVATGDGYAGIDITGMSIWSESWVSTGDAGLDPYGMHSICSSAVMLSDLDIRGFERGVYIDDGDGIYVYDSTLTDNDYGVYTDGVYEVRVYNSLITSSAMTGIYLEWTSEYDGDIAYNTLVGNGFAASSSDTMTGAIAIGRSTNVNVQDNIIVSNAIGLDCDGCTYTGNNNLVWGNATDYVNDASADSTDLSEDPLFADASELDYHLTSSSPAIDAGVDPDIYIYTDFEGEGRPQGSGYDIGYDEYAVSATELIISEVMTNPSVEDTGEFVEVYNPGTDTVDLAGLVLSDGDDDDVLEAYGTSGTTVGPGGYAMIIDAEYDGAYGLDASISWLTTGDTNLGNGLTTSDSVTLYDSDGSTIITTCSHPSNPGDGVSMERVSVEGLDDEDNWEASTCGGGSSPGIANCASEAGDPVSDLYEYLFITEIMANPTTESTGEFIELYNGSESDIDLAGYIIYDGDAADPLQGFSDPTDTMLAANGIAVILDADYAGEYSISSSILLLTTDDSALGSGLAVNDPVYLYEPNGVSLIDSYTWPFDPGDGISVEKVDPLFGDRATNWQASECSGGCSPGDGPCFP